MKKAVSLLLILILLLNINVFASNNYDFLNQQIEHGEYSADFSIKFNKPMKIFEVFKPQMQITPNLNLCDIIDFESMFKSMENGNNTVNIKTNASSDLKKITAEIKIDESTPLYINKNLSVNIKQYNAFWLNMDMSDINNPVYEITMQTALSDKYIHIDVFKLISDDEEKEKFQETMISFLNKEKLTELSKQISDLFVANTTVKRNRNTYTFKMTKENGDKFITDVLKTINNAFQITELIENNATVTLDRNMLNNIKAVGENGMEFVYEVGFDNKVRGVNGSINLYFNLYDLLGPTASLIPNLTPETGAIDFTLKINARVKSFEEQEIDFPRLTDDNTIEIEIPKYEPIYEENYDDSFEESEEFEYVEDESQYLSIYQYEYIPDETGFVYIGLRNLIETYNLDNNLNNEISFENGVITISTKDGEGESFKTAQLTVNSKTIVTDGKTFEADNPVIIKDGVTYVDKSVIKKLFDFDVVWATKSLLGSEVSIDFERKLKNEF